MTQLELRAVSSTNFFNQPPQPINQSTSHPNQAKNPPTTIVASRATMEISLSSQRRTQTEGG